MDCDTISTLSDSLLAKILLYLPISDSVQTSVLSKRWGSLWLKVTKLDLNAIDFLPYDEALAVLMKRYLEFNRRGSHLKKFKIKYPNNDKLRGDHANNSKRVMEWIAEVVHRGGKHLDVEHRRVSCTRSIDLPKYMYVSKTVVSLKLVNVGLENPKFVVSLPRLKMLHLEKIRYKSNGFYIIGKLISASCVLEDLNLDFRFPSNLEAIDFSPVVPTSGSKKTKKAVFTKVPRCLSSTLERVTINQLIMKGETGIKLVNYFLENSAVLKKLNLILRTASVRDQKPETYKKLLTPTKLSRECQVFVY